MTLRVLLVEDNPLNSELVTAVLELARCAVTVVGDGASFRAQVTAGAAPDIVLMDVLLPDANGVELLAELRRSAAWSGIPVVALTAQALEGDRERFERAGFAGVLNKPIDTRTFAREVARMASEAREALGPGVVIRR